MYGHKAPNTTSPGDADYPQHHMTVIPRGRTEGQKGLRIPAAGLEPARDISQRTNAAPMYHWVMPTLYPYSAYHGS